MKGPSVDRSRYRYCDRHQATVLELERVDSQGGRETTDYDTQSFAYEPPWNAPSGTVSRRLDRQSFVSHRTVDPRLDGASDEFRDHSHGFGFGFRGDRQRRDRTRESLDRLVDAVDRGDVGTRSGRSGVRPAHRPVRPPPVGCALEGVDRRADANECVLGTESARWTGIGDTDEATITLRSVG